ncbi:lanthionine synthetase LanC family protein, partial [Enterococcus gallinarum]
IDYVENNNYFSLGAGLGHGLSGIILALSRFSKVENIDRKLISQLVDYEDSYFSEEYGNYLDTRNNSYDSYFFCYGLPGIILSRIEAESIGAVERNYVQNLVNILINKVLDEGLALDNTLCHGWFGIQDILLIASENGYLTKEQYQEIKKGHKVIFQENELNYFNKCSHIFLGNGGRKYLKLREEISIPSLLNLSYL